MAKDATIKHWETEISKHLVGKKIVGIHYMTDKEQKAYGWYKKAVLIVLDDGNVLIPSADDEGNDAGSIFTTIKELPTIPVC